MPKGPDESRREELLAAIERIVLTEGFADLRVGTLASRLRCSRSTLYKLADSKDDLVLLVFERMMRRTVERCKAEALKEESPPDRIRVYFRLTERARLDTTPAFWRDVGGWEPTAALREEMNRIVCEHVTAFVAEGVAKGVFRPVNPRFVARVACLAAVSTHHPAFLDGTGLDWAEAMESLGDLVVAGLMQPRCEDALAEAGGAA